jgi:hypothetical protein
MPPQRSRAPGAELARHRPTEGPRCRPGLGGRKWSITSSSFQPARPGGRQLPSKTAVTCRPRLSGLSEGEFSPALNRHHLEPGLDLASGLSLGATRAAHPRAARPAMNRESRHPHQVKVSAQTGHGRGRCGLLHAGDRVASSVRIRIVGLSVARLRQPARPQGYLRGRAPGPVSALPTLVGVGQPSRAPDQGDGEEDSIDRFGGLDAVGRTPSRQAEEGPHGLVRQHRFGHR